MAETLDKKLNCKETEMKKKINWNIVVPMALVALFALAILNGIYQGKKNTNAYIDDVIAKADRALAMADCAPSCEGRECGTDGCDGTCGGCDWDNNETWVNNQCEEGMYLMRIPIKRTYLFPRIYDAFAKILFCLTPQIFLERGWVIPPLGIAFPPKPPPKRGMAHGGPWAPDTVELTPEAQEKLDEQLRNMEPPGHNDPIWSHPQAF